MIRRLSLLVTVACVLIALPAIAWKGESSMGVRPISEVNEKAEVGDYVSVEGHLVHIDAEHGSMAIGTLEDETGRVVIAVPNYVRTPLADEGAHRSVVRVTGKWDTGPFEGDTEGVRVQKAEIVDR